MTDATGRRRGLLIPAALALITLAGADFAFGRFARSHFLYEHQFGSALQKGDHCVVTFGDSRMLAGVDSETMERELAARGARTCYGQLAVGGAGVVAHYMALRRYLEHEGRRPRAVIWGVNPDTLVAKEPEVGGFVGNGAVALAWSRPSDVTLLYPEFPWSGFDNGFRFLAARSTNLSTYASLVWHRVQSLQDQLTAPKGATSANAGEHNRFGATADFMRLGNDMAKQVAEADLTERALQPVVEAAAELCDRYEVPLVFIELPMPEHHRKQIDSQPNTRRVREALQALAARHHDRVVSLIAPPWLEDRHFVDGLHVGAEGARKLSADLAALAASELERGSRP